MFGSVSRRIFSASLLVLLTGCSSLGFGGDKQPATDVTVAPQPVAAGQPPATPAGGAPAYIAGKCPQIVIRDEGAVYRTYAKGAKDDPSQLTYQASLVDGTRQCTTDGANLGVTVVVQGRLVAGPAGGSGKVTLPIRVSVQDGDKVLYSDLTNFEAEIPAGSSTTQFLFTDNKVSVTGGSGGFTSVYISFDQGPQKPAAGKKVAKKK